MPHIGSKIFLKFTSRWLFICHLRGESRYFFRFISLLTHYALLEAIGFHA